MRNEFYFENPNNSSEYCNIIKEYYKHKEILYFSIYAEDKCGKEIDGFRKTIPINQQLSEEDEKSYMEMIKCKILKFWDDDSK